MPSVCVLCGDPGNHLNNNPDYSFDGPYLHNPGATQSLDLCKHCQNELPQLISACARCAEPLSASITADALCGRCQTQPPAFERCLAMFAYQPPVDHLLQALKFNGRLEMARLLGELMGHWLEEVIDSRPDVLIPVPLHAGRLRERGFNQAVELARPIARHLGLSIDNHCSRRIKTTAPQSDLSRKQRIRNVKGAFEALKPVSGHVAVIDDVMTTGSTAHEFAKTLIRAGATSVDVWVCARV